MVHPSWQRLLVDTPVEQALTPVYPLTDGLQQRRLAGLVSQALALLPDDEQLECLPRAMRSRYRLTSLREALRFVHRPPPRADVEPCMAGHHPAQRRLAFDELIAHNLGLKQLRAAVRARSGPRIAAGPARGEPRCWRRCRSR